MHISEETLKYFQYLSFDDRIGPKFKEMINFFILNNKNNNIDMIEKRTPNLKMTRLEEKKKKRKLNLMKKMKIRNIQNH